MSRNVILATAIAIGLGFATGAIAQTTPTTSTPTTTTRPHNAASETGRDVDQQKRIEQGLQSGQLSSGEARRLEAGEAHIDKTEQRDLRNGSLSASERAQIQREQNRESKAIYNQKHDAQTGNPDSLKSNMEQANVQRNINQEQRLHNGVTNGSLSNRELSRQEGNEAHVDRMESRRDTLRQTGKIQRTDNRDSRRIHRSKHNARVRH
ncbi:MAG TPA: hypothetical protein VHD89_07830 [Rhodanobacteraceae bacterium]|jgi:hypothetical protein|nr:hypothetical protein [Rhodanobacteraceae bacterium]